MLQRALKNVGEGVRYARCGVEDGQPRKMRKRIAKNLRSALIRAQDAQGLVQDSQTNRCGAIDRFQFREPAVHGREIGDHQRDTGDAAGEGQGACRKKSGNLLVIAFSKGEFLALRVVPGGREQFAQFDSLGGRCEMENRIADNALRVRPGHFQKAGVRVEDGAFHTQM